MQTNYTPKTGLRNKIVTWGAVVVTALGSLFNSGCANHQNDYSNWKKSLTPEQREKQNQLELKSLMQMNANEENKKKQELASLMQMNENEVILRQQLQNNYPTESETDKDFRDMLDLYKSVFWGLGSDITFYEYQRRNP